jgi:uncharacterized protein (TIGR02611 family)
MKRLFLKIKSGLKMQGIPAPVRRTIIGVVGGTVLLLGVALIVLPGPAFIVIPIGLTILATEFAWARRYLRKARKLLKSAANNLRSGKPGPPDRPGESPPASSS